MADERAHADKVARLVWTARKIRSKDRRYLLRRLSYGLRKWAVDRWFPRPGLARHVELRLPNRSEVRQHFIDRDTPVWHFSGAEIQEIVGRIPAMARERTIAKASSMREGRFHLTGRAPVILSPMDWDYACFQDVLWTRELNRHEVFEQLGFAFHYTSNALYAHAFIELAGSWIERYADRIGRIPWDKPFQVGRRINSWIWAFFLFLEWEGWSEGERRAYLQTLGLLTEYLYQTLEYHSPGNHILLEAKALALCAETFPEFVGATRWRHRAWEILDREMNAQICRDGVHAERSTMYHRAIAGELAELWLFSNRNGLPWSEKLRKVVCDMAEFQRWIDLGKGEYPQLGDSLTRDSYYRFSAPGVVATQDGRPLELEKGLPDHSWWITNLEDRFVSSSPEPGRQAHARAFPEGGYFVSRSSADAVPDVLVWDCGPFGYQANRNHAHADALSVVLSVGGEALLVDPGSGGPWDVQMKPNSPELGTLTSRWLELRGTRAHNTVSVDGQDQAVLAVRNEIWNPPDPSLSLWQTSEEFDLMRGRHDGYARLADPVIHERLILASRRGYWIIMDALSGCEVHYIEARYHLAPGSILDAFPAEGVFCVRKDTTELVLTFFEIGDRSDRLTFHEEERLGELRDGVAERFPVICASRHGVLPLILGTVLTVPERGVKVLGIELEGSEASLDIQTAEDLDHVKIRTGIGSSGLGLESVADIQRVDTDLVQIGRWTFGEARKGVPQADTRPRSSIEAVPAGSGTTAGAEST